MLDLFLPMPATGATAKALSVSFRVAQPVLAEAAAKEVRNVVPTAIHNATQTENLDVGLRETDISFAPQLMTDVGSEIYGVVRSGSIIVRIDVDEQGRPFNLRRLYSDVAPQIARQVEQRILSAKFQPAIQHGKVVSDSMNIMVTLEPSQTLRTLGGG